MTEIDLLKRSSFAWVDLFGDDAALMANGFTAWGGIFFLDGRWHAVGGAKGESPRLLGIGERAVCLAAGRRLAERARDRRERLQVEVLAATSRRPTGSSPTCRRSSGMTTA